MQKYGLRIGLVGIEFPSIEDRNKAIQYFTKGSDVTINLGSGIKYKNGEGNFSVYDRNTKEVIVNCHECDGSFLVDTCNQRKYPYKYSYSDNWEERDEYICDACFSKQFKLKEIHDAKEILKGNEE